MDFEEKPRLHAVWVNSGFFVIEPRALDVIEGDDKAWENGPLTRLARRRRSWRRSGTQGFWQCMDTPKDRQALEQAWANRGRRRGKCGDVRVLITGTDGYIGCLLAAT